MGSDAVKKNVMKKGSVSGTAVQAHNEKVAEQIITEISEKIGLSVDRKDLMLLKKSHEHKCLLAALVKRNTIVKNDWLAERLVMGHSAGMSNIIKRFSQSSKGLKQIIKYEKTFKSKGPI